MLLKVLFCFINSVVKSRHFIRTSAVITKTELRTDSAFFLKKNLLNSNFYFGEHACGQNNSEHLR